MAKKKVVEKAAKPAKPAKVWHRGPPRRSQRHPVPSPKRSPSPQKQFHERPLRRSLPPKKSSARRPAPVVTIARKPAPELEPTQRKKGVRKATISSGVHDEKATRKLGRSRIPINAPLDVVFQNDIQARELFMFLGIHSIRDLEQFNPDDLVLRLTGPAKLTVGRIRKILAMNNRCLSNDEEFAWMRVCYRARE